jgi:molybdopterin-biosynthesis enzyme MoeA-like protein
MNYKFYAVIIGTEILDGRRTDKHFPFVKSELQKRGWELSGSMVIEDDRELIHNSLKILSSIENSVVFTFGGIGSTPDDYTRQVAGDVFTSGEMEFQEEFINIIKDRFGSERFDVRKNMAYLPVGSQLLYNNPINRMCGFHLNERVFFVPGFPEMAHPMIVEALDKYFFKNSESFFRKSLTVNAPEGYLIEWMEALPSEIKLSSLPKTNLDENGKMNPTVDIQIESKSSAVLEDSFQNLQEFLKIKGFSYDLL